jgi:hypothetical protein
LDRPALHEHLVSFCELFVRELHEFYDVFRFAETLVDESHVALQILLICVGLYITSVVLWSTLTTETKVSLISVMSICRNW